MSFVDVFPIEPVIATKRAPLRSRTAPAIAASAAKGSSGTSVAAAPRANACLRYVGAVADRDEEVALLDPARVDLHACDLVRPHGARPTVPGPGPRTHVQRERDHAGCSARSSSRATSRSSNGMHRRRAISCPCSWPLPGDQHDVSFAAGLDRPCDRRAPVGLDLELGRAGEDLVDDRERVLAARIVGRDDRDVGELVRDPPHERALLAVAVAAAAEDADDAAVARARAPRSSTRSSDAGLCA